MNTTNAAATTAASKPTAAATSAPKSGKPQRRMARPPIEGAAATSAPTAVPSACQRTAAPAPGSKSAAVLALLQREGGATLAELVAATSWLPHTTRAALNRAVLVMSHSFDFVIVGGASAGTVSTSFFQSRTMRGRHDR